MYILLSLLGGISAKAYDDLYDNHLLQSFKNDTLMEYLKGLHYITFTTVSIEDPIFFIIWYIANFLNHLTNEDAYNEPYERSLLYSFLLLFIIISQKNFTNLELIDYLLLLCMCGCMFFEPLFQTFILENKEFSYNKLINRTVGLLFAICLFFLGNSKTTRNIFAYCIGYLLLSVIVQYYSINIKETDTSGKKKTN